MQEQYKYNGLEDRRAKVKEAESKGLCMLHDDFDQDWKEGREPKGVMTFTDEPEPSISSEPGPEPRNIYQEFDALVCKLKAKGMID